MLKAFRESDPDRTGYIPTMLLRLIVQHVNDMLTEEDLDRMEHQIDPTESGEVHYENTQNLDAIHTYID
jgi:Ca2+-binding EF-hand superfamily protein